MVTIKSMSDGKGYAGNHLSNNDYYSVGESIDGQWIGHGAELLGLEGKVDLAHFEAIREGKNPFTGEFLRQRQSTNHFKLDGEQVAAPRTLYDFTVSAPKAVSVQAIEDPRLIEAHNIAVSETAVEMERLAATRVRKFGANEDRTTSNLVIARYDHDTSRELDPQLHSHLVAGNLTYDGIEGKWKALQAGEIYQEARYLTEVYRNAAAREVMARGYEIEDRLEHGQDNGFGIVGIKEETLEKYSQRSEQKEKAIAKFLETNGRQPSKNEVSILVRDTRAGKLTDITTAEVKAGQRARLDPAEAETLQALHQRAQEYGTVREQALAAPSLAYASEHTYERVSVAKNYELLAEALRHGRGRIELPELKGALVSEVASGSMLTANGEVATKESLERERRMIRVINNGLNQYEPLGRSHQFVVSDRLRPEQKQAVLTALESRDFAFNIAGAAGVGKTNLLPELHRGLQEARRSVVAVAPSTGAVEELRKVGFSDAVTVARLLSDPKRRDELRGQVLLIDEAGMVGSKDMAELLDVAKQKGARIVYSGDSQQIKSVSEGDALRVLERESKLSGFSVLQVQRQTNADYKAAVEALRNNPAKGFAKLEEMGVIREVPWLTRAQEVSREYREASAVLNRHGQPRSVLVVASTHDEIKSITHAIRNDRQKAGGLAAGEVFVQHSALNWTEAQKKQFHNYQPGHALEFHKAVKGVAKNEALEVVRADKSGVIARKASGETLTISKKHAPNFAVFEKQEIDIAPGDKLLLQRNWKDRHFKATNGELVSVQSVEGGAIKLEDGRQLPSGYRQLTHGYAVTAHKSQGKTVDFQIVAGDQMAQDLFYVAVSRGREGVRVITSDSLRLQESIGVSGERQSASELARRTAPAANLEQEDYRLYQAQQQLDRQRRPALEQTISTKTKVTQEIKHGNRNSDFGIGI